MRMFIVFIGLLFTLSSCYKTYTYKEIRYIITENNQKKYDENIENNKFKKFKKKKFICGFFYYIKLFIQHEEKF